MNNDLTLLLESPIRLSPKAELRYISDSIGYGIFAKKLFNVGEEILFVPFECCITPSVLPQELDQVPEEIRLAHAIAKAHDRSRSTESEYRQWHMYIEFVLQSNGLAVVPCMWSDDERKARLAAGSLKYMYDSTILHLTEIANRLGIPIWAVAYMLSRSFVKTNDNSTGITCVPFADLFNHSSIHWNTRIRQCDEGFRFVAERGPIEPGREFFNCYSLDTSDGSFDWISMMITHGFIESTGLPSDVVYIPLYRLREPGPSFVMDEDDDLLIRVCLKDRETALQFLDAIPPIAEYRNRLIDRMIETTDRTLEELHDAIQSLTNQTRNILLNDFENFKKFKSILQEYIEKN
jgi:hypothetical protein